MDALPDHVRRPEQVRRLQVHDDVKRDPPQLFVRDEGVLEHGLGRYRILSELARTKKRDLSSSVAGDAGDTLILGAHEHDIAHPGDLRVLDGMDQEGFAAERQQVLTRQAL
jgi:hypothetical protein